MSDYTMYIRPQGSSAQPTQAPTHQAPTQPSANLNIINTAEVAALSSLMALQTHHAEGDASAAQRRAEPAAASQTAGAEHADSSPLTPEQLAWLEIAATEFRNQHIADAANWESIRLQIAALRAPMTPVAPPPLPGLLHMAVITNDPGAIERALDSGEYNINAVDAHGSTAIMLAAFYDHPACFKVLMSRGASLTMENHQGLRVIDIAASHSRGIFELLYAFGGTPTVPAPAVSWQVDTFRELLENHQKSPSEASYQAIRSMFPALMGRCLPEA